jgi:hypothetical protein
MANQRIDDASDNGAEAGTGDRHHEATGGLSGSETSANAANGQRQLEPQTGPIDRKGGEGSTCRLSEDSISIAVRPKWQTRIKY